MIDEVLIQNLSDELEVYEKLNDKIGLSVFAYNLIELLFKSCQSRRELKVEVERLKDDNMWLMRQISLCRGRMSEKDIEAVCKQWKEWKAQKEGSDV